jgi:hypothetical protein
LRSVVPGKTHKRNKSHPKPRCGQVHPTARSMISGRPNINTIRLRLNSKVLLLPILGKSRASTPSHTPTPSEGQVHPTARRLISGRPNINTIRLRLNSKVLPLPILGKSRASTPSHTPTPSEGQVHPIARSVIPRHPTVHTNRRSIHSKVTPLAPFREQLEQTAEKLDSFEEARRQPCRKRMKVLGSKSDLPSDRSLRLIPNTEPRRRGSGACFITLLRFPGHSGIAGVILAKRPVSCSRDYFP